MRTSPLLSRDAAEPWLQYPFGWIRVTQLTDIGHMPNPSRIPEELNV
jgi:hypothetical protein